jgi:hypothetical protein
MRPHTPMAQPCPESNHSRTKAKRLSPIFSSAIIDAHSHRLSSNAALGCRDALPPNERHPPRQSWHKNGTHAFYRCFPPRSRLAFSRSATASAFLLAVAATNIGRKDVPHWPVRGRCNEKFGLTPPRRSPCQASSVRGEGSRKRLCPRQACCRGEGGRHANPPSP